MVCEDTLKVKNLPKELTSAEKEDFLKHFGATKVKVISPKSGQRSVVYAKFESKEIAREVLFRLHQTYILKNRLCVEYADQEIGIAKIKKVEPISTSSKEHLKAFISKLDAFNYSVDFHQPPPPHLKYSYPKANRPTINNIGHALATVPKFYTQVLHLMNRMNLPPPFAVPDPMRQQLMQQQHIVQQKTPIGQQRKPENLQESSSESELESEEEFKQQNKEVIPQKRVLKQKKMAKRPKFIKPPEAPAGGNKTERPQEVFEKSDIQIHKKIEMKVSASALEQKSDICEEVGTIPSHASEESSENKTEPFITTEELSSNQIPEKDLAVLPVFKNYHAGAPSTRLYIKNLAKTVDLKDLEYIFNRYKGAEKGHFDIRLMQEGRMKGQAFITLDSVEIAQKALKETNAYILKDKPLVVVFGKATAVKK